MEMLKIQLQMAGTQTTSRSHVYSAIPSLFRPLGTPTPRSNTAVSYSPYVESTGPHMYNPSLLMTSTLDGVRLSLVPRGQVEKKFSDRESEQDGIV